MKCCGKCFRERSVRTYPNHPAGGRKIINVPECRDAACKCHTTQEKKGEGWEELELALYEKWKAEHPDVTHTHVLINKDVQMTPPEWWVRNYVTTRLYSFIRSTREAARREIEEKYSELLYAVGKKHKDETRHETALRYIKNAEQGEHRAVSTQLSDSKKEV